MESVQWRGELESIPNAPRATGRNQIAMANNWRDLRQHVGKGGWRTSLEMGEAMICVVQLDETVSALTNHRHEFTDSCRVTTFVTEKMMRRKLIIDSRQTRMCVRKPAARPWYSRSSPTAPPIRTQSSMRPIAIHCQSSTTFVLPD